MTRHLIVLAVVAVATCASSPAGAATLSRTGTTITYEASRGEKSLLEVSVHGSRLSFTEMHDPISAQPSNVVFTAGPGCKTPDRPPDADPDPDPDADCDAAGANLLALNLGDQKDEITSFEEPHRLDLPAGMKLRVDGGAGNDRLIGSPGNDVINGSAGDDTIYGSGGKDVQNGGTGADHLTGYGTLMGGPGNDSFSLYYVAGSFTKYASRVFGGSGNDLFVTGNGKHDKIDCGSGSKDYVLWGKYKGEDKLKGCETHVP